MPAANAIYVFPGQGSQFAGMSADFMAHKVTAPLFEEANDIMGQDLAKLMREGTAEELKQTHITQPALYVAGYAAIHYLLKHADKPLSELVKFVAGHSLGEYTALAAADAFDFATGLKLVKERGLAMHDATAKDEGAMAAILGIPLAQVETYCHSTGCFVANDNCENQVVIAGPMAAVDEASNIAAMEQPRKIMRLDVSGPFHTPMMYPASERMQEVFADVTFNKPTVPVILNVTAQPCDDPEELPARLIQQVTQTVRWRESMKFAADQGVTNVVELGCGKVLTGLAKRCDERLVGQSLTSPWDIDTYLIDIGL